MDCKKEMTKNGALIFRGGNIEKIKRREKEKKTKVNKPFEKQRGLFPGKIFFTNILVSHICS